MTFRSPDYKKYTLDELYEALESIDRVNYPERFELLKETIEKKRGSLQLEESIIEEVCASKEEDFFMKWLKRAVLLDLIWLLSISTIIAVAKGTHGIFIGIFLFLFPFQFSGFYLQVVPAWLLCSLLGYKFPQIKILGGGAAVGIYGYYTIQFANEPVAFTILLTSSLPFLGMTGIVIFMATRKLIQLRK